MYEEQVNSIIDDALAVAEEVMYFAEMLHRNDGVGFDLIGDELCIGIGQDGHVIYVMLTLEEAALLLNNLKTAVSELKEIIELRLT